MSNAIFDFTAEIREDLGKGASRRLRRLTGKVPAILYGGNEKPTALQLEGNVVRKALQHDSVYSHILTLSIGGKKQKVVLKDLQRHHFKNEVFHMDFLRVKDTDVLTMHVPLHYLNQENAPGVKAGGVVNHNLMDLEVRCQAKDLPEAIEIDLGNMEMDAVMHLQDIALPKGVEILALIHDKDNNQPVVAIHKPKRVQEPESETTTDTAAASEEAAKEDKEGAESKDKT